MAGDGDQCVRVGWRRAVQCWLVLGSMSKVEGCFRFQQVDYVLQARSFRSGQTQSVLGAFAGGPGYWISRLGCVGCRLLSSVELVAWCC